MTDVIFSVIKSSHREELHYHEARMETNADRSHFPYFVRHFDSLHPAQLTTEPGLSTKSTIHLSTIAISVLGLCKIHTDVNGARQADEDEGDPQNNEHENGCIRPELLPISDILCDCNNYRIHCGIRGQ